MVKSLTGALSKAELSSDTNLTGKVSTYSYTLLFTHKIRVFYPVMYSPPYKMVSERYHY